MPPVSVAWAVSADENEGIAHCERLIFLMFTNLLNVRTAVLYGHVLLVPDREDLFLRPRTKELLYVMLWTFETLSRQASPTQPRNNFQRAPQAASKDADQSSGGGPP